MTATRSTVPCNGLVSSLAALVRGALRSRDEAKRGGLAESPAVLGVGEGRSPTKRTTWRRPLTSTTSSLTVSFPAALGVDGGGTGDGMTSGWSTRKEVETAPDRKAGCD